MSRVTNMREQTIEGFRLSPQQKRLWLLQRGSRNLPYRAQCSVLIEGNLDKKVLKAALQTIVDRHEIIRTTFHSFQEMALPLQVINNPGSLSWKADDDLGGLNPEDQEARIDAIFEELKQLPFDLQRGPALRISLARLSTSKWILFIALPGFCADKVTLRNFVRELGRSYSACLDGHALSGDPMQYADFSQWQNELLESENLEAGRGYWRKQDNRVALNLKLPCENQNSGNTEFEPRFLRYRVKPEVFAKLEATVRRYETSMPVFLLACWHILFWRLTGHSDTIVGSEFDGRKHEELKDALGLMAKYLPLRCHLEANLTFRDILRQVNESIADGYKRQDVFCWEQIEEPIGTVESPLCFSLGFDYEKRAEKRAVGDVSFAIARQYACVERFRVRLSSVHRDDSLITEFHYDSNLLGAEEIKRLKGQFHALLESVTGDPPVPIGKLKILNSGERQRLLFDFNSTGSPYAKRNCVHELFEEQARRMPENIAVACDDRKLTYARLNAHANQTARHLKALGVGPEVPVAVCLDPSPEMIIGLLGILKAGGAYVPLDASDPKERLGFMVEDSGAEVLLTQERMLETLPGFGGQTVCLDTNWPSIARQSGEDFFSGVTPGNLAYVMYTSGSTGQPKGVMIEHRSLVNYLAWVNAYLLGASVERLPLTTKLTFDACLKQVFAPLLSGREVWMLSGQTGSEPEALLLELAARARVGLNCVPSLWKVMLEMVQSGHVAMTADSLASLFLGGEPLGGELVRESLAALPDLRIWNLYGVTEATANSIVGRVASGDRVTIGRPIANTQAYILDSHLEPVPVHAAGELYLGGAGLARGYLNGFGLTAEKFIPDPFSDEPGARLYKTGDRARYLPDGDIEFLGRLDYQVKVRGFRVELQEIEAALVQHPVVREAVLVAREDRPGDRRLAAYIVPNKDKSTTASDLRHFLKQKLPDYMIPSVFIVLDTMPRTSSGKINRRALPEPDAARSKLGEELVAPRTPVEEVLAGIWAEILGVERVGVHDNFFDSGGHSLLATRVISKIRRALRIELPVRSLFEAPTVAGLGAHIEAFFRIGSAPQGSPHLKIGDREEIEI